MKVAGTSAPPETAPAASRPGLRELKKQRTRDLLLRSALELFTERGYEETTVDDIAEVPGIGRRTADAIVAALAQQGAQVGQRPVSVNTATGEIEE